MIIPAMIPTPAISCCSPSLFNWDPDIPAVSLFNQTFLLKGLQCFSGLPIVP